MYPKFPIFCFFPKYYTSYSQYTTPSPVLELVIFEVYINEVTVYEKKPCGRETQCLPPTGLIFRTSQNIDEVRAWHVKGTLDKTFLENQ